MITILMATYNGERYVRQQLDSILAQSETDWRLWISDDGSKDATPAILREYVDAFPGKIRLLSYEGASGSAQANFFRMLQTAREEGCGYVMLSDQDDVWLPDKIRITMAKMAQTEQVLGEDMPILVHTDLKVVDGNLRELSPSLFSYQGLSPEHCELRHYLLQNNVTGCTMMINRALLSFMDETPPVCPMHDWWLAILAAAFGSVQCELQATMLYRQHGDNQVGAKRRKNLFVLIADKFQNRATVRENYRKMYRQAAFLLENYERKMTQEQRRLVGAFLQLEKSGRLRKIRLMCRHRLFMNTFTRTVGKFLFMS